MADQKVRITQLPPLNNGDGAIFPVNKNNVDYKFDIKNLLQSKNNLSEVDPEKARANLGVYSKQESDNKFSGTWITTTLDLISSSTDYASVRTRGFYDENDGGDGVWVKTGNVDISLAKSHIPERAIIYNANGIEYQLSITSKEVNAKSNGAKEVAGQNALSGDDFVCIGQVINGIAEVFGYVYDDAGWSAIKSGEPFGKINIVLTGGFYRMGKEGIKPRAGVSCDLGHSLISFSAHSDYTYEKTGKRIDGLSTLENASYWRAKTTSWDLASWNNCNLSNFTLVGDHTPSKTRGGCTGGVGLNIVNPQHVTLENVVVHGWLMDCISREYNSYVPAAWGIVNSNMDYINKRDDSVTTQQGHFYGVTYINCEFLGSRDGTFMNIADWSTFIGGNIFNQYNWLEGVDGVAPLYIMWQLASNWNMQGGQIGVYHDDTGSSSAHYPYTYAPARATIYDTCRRSDWGGAYSEWDRDFIEVGVLGATSAVNPTTDGALSLLQRYSGLKIAFDIAYKPDRKSSLVKFSKEMFGYFSGDDNAGWKWNDPLVFSRGDVARGLSQFTVGSPVKDSGAFLHGGYDFKYGTYNIGFYNSVLPDVDSLRGSRDKQFLNDLGLIHNNGSLMFPLHAPAYDSNIVIWFKDLTGNYDLSNVVMNEQSVLDNSNMTNVYTSKANLLFDYGNGWKAAVVRNLRPFGYSEERDWSPQNYLRITTTNKTPIILKSIQAFQGGVPIYPSALESYIPESQCNGVWGTQTSSTGVDLYPNSLGGGIFYLGDKIAPWVYRSNRGRFTYAVGTSTYGNPRNTRFIAGVGSYGGYLTPQFTAKITYRDNLKTVIEVEESNAPYIALGLPINIVSTTGSGSIGRKDLVSRGMNQDGTFNNTYTVRSDLGAVGDVITIDNSQQNYTFLGTVYAGGEFDGAVSVSSNILPKQKNASDIGSSSLPFRNAYLQNAVTVLSDANKKSGSSLLNDKEIACAKALASNFKRYKLKDAIAEKGEEDARYHIGVIAQEVIDVFTQHGLDWGKYGVVTYEKWDAQEAVTQTIPESKDDSGVVIEEEHTVEVTPRVEGGEVYMIRYDELNCFISAGQEERLRSLEKLLDAKSDS